MRRVWSMSPCWLPRPFVYMCIRKVSFSSCHKRVQRFRHFIFVKIHPAISLSPFVCARDKMLCSARGTLVGEYWAAGSRVSESSSSTFLVRRVKGLIREALSSLTTGIISVRCASYACSLSMFQHECIPSLKGFDRLRSHLKDTDPSICLFFFVFCKTAGPHGTALSTSTDWLVAPDDIIALSLLITPPTWIIVGLCSFSTHSFWRLLLFSTCCRKMKWPSLTVMCYIRQHLANCIKME